MSESIQDREVLPPNVPLLKKPFNAAELFSTVNGVLSESAQAWADIRLSWEKSEELIKKAEAVKSELHEMKQAAATTIEETRKITNS